METETEKMGNSQATSNNFENLKYNPSENTGDILTNDSCDPDSNFFQTNFQSLDTPYLLPEEFHQLLDNKNTTSVSVLHLNIRSINKNFDNFKLFLSSLNYCFSIICFSETWLNDRNVDNSNYKLPNCSSIHQIRTHSRGGGVSIYIHKDFEFKIRNDLSINCKDVESLGVELLHDKTKNTLFNVLYRPPNGQIETFENFLRHLFHENKNSNKNFHIAGDFNLNLLDHNENKKVQNFLNIIHQNGILPTRNKPTRVTRKSATAISHIITNNYIESSFKTAIIKFDISDHFPICILFPSDTSSAENEILYQYKRIIDNERITAFSQKLFEYDWTDTIAQNKPIEAYELFLKDFSVLYEAYFPLKKEKIRSKDLKSPWITKGLKKSSKRKQKLYAKFFKKRSEKTEKDYLDYKKLFESLKKRSKKMHYSNLILKYKDNIKKTWQVIKEALGKEKSSQSLPKTVLVNELSVTQSTSIAENFNKFFTEIGPKLAKNIKKSSKNFAHYLHKHLSELSEHPLSINELKDAFFALKINKSAGYGNISFNILKKCFGVLHKPLFHIFNCSIQTGIFPDKLKIAGVTPFFKGGDNRELGNYRPISVLPCFSKILEKIMYNRLNI